MVTRFLKLAGVLAALFIGCVAPAWAADDLSLAANGNLRLLGNVDAVVDPSGKMTFEQVFRSKTLRWAHIRSTPEHSAVTEEAVWYRFSLHVPSDQAYVLAWPPEISRVDMYSIAPGGAVERRSAGYDVQRQELSQHMLTIPEHDYGRLWYVRALTGYALSSPRVEPLRAALGTDVTLLTMFGGFFVAILLFNLILYFVMREKPLLYYAAVMLMLLGLLASDDELWRFFPSTEFQRILVHDVFGWLYFAGTALFSIEFLSLKKRDPKMRRWLLVFAVASAAGIPADVFGAGRSVDFGVQAILIGLLLLVFVAGMRSFRTGYRPARFLVAGSLAVTLGTVVNLAATDWGLPLGPYAMYLFEIGIGLEALLLTVALADRMNDLARQNADLRVSRAELISLATHDQLTGVANRRAFDDRLDEEWHRAQRNGTTVGLVMIDIDHFKLFNDEFGHIAGDACLSRIALACASTLRRTSDFFARYGGEEFAAIVVTPFEPDVDFVAEKMRLAVIAERIEHPGNEGGFCTISLGAAKMHPGSDDDKGRLIAAADAALYAAKDTGRNRVCVGNA